MTLAAAHPEPSPAAGAAQPDPWLAAEPTLRPALRDVVARGLRRPWRVVVLAAAVVVLLIGFRVTRPPTYVASLMLRMDESELQDPRATPRPPSRIREHVLMVALSRERLLALMERHGLAERIRKANPIAAVAAFREDLDVDVVRNYFLFDRDTAGHPRSAQVVLSYSGNDREVVRDVVHELGEIILHTQAEARALRLAQARDLNAAQAQRLRQQLRGLEAQRARLLAGGPGRSLLAGDGDLLSVQREAARLAAQLEDLERRASELDMARDAEKLNLGLAFRVVDEVVLTERRPLAAASVVVASVLLFAALAPITLLVVGAFDRRLHLAADVLACGFPLLGVVPFAPGDDAGCLAARLRAAARRPTS